MRPERDPQMGTRDASASGVTGCLSLRQLRSIPGPVDEGDPRAGLAQFKQNNAVIQRVLDYEVTDLQNTLTPLPALAETDRTAVLHLTAVMQFSGFKSVIVTMCQWAIVDEDGQDLSDHFYNKMFTAGAQVASYEQSARALQHATQRLRTKMGISLERWVNSVHYGT